MKTRYRKYDDSIINMIVETKNPNLFPELNIPRTTALYWINHKKSKIKLNNSKSKKYEIVLNESKKELLQERSKRLFLQKILKLRIKFSCKRKVELEVSKEIKRFSKYIAIETLCKLSHLNIKKYYALTNQYFFARTHANQLTIKEQKKLIGLSKRKDLKHLSIKRLQLYAYRKGLLYCNYHTWRKYIQTHNIKRNVKKQTFKGHVKKTKANYPNQYWHIDITEFKSQEGKKIYLQALMDNYSRKILNWTLSFKKSANTTVTTLNHIFNLVRPKIIVCDGGGENNNFIVKELLAKEGIKREICTRLNKSSNCMIESFFHILKNKYINKYKSYDFSELNKILEISITKYNNSPIPSHHGASANEVYNGLTNTTFLKDDLKSKINQARIKRLKSKL